jgi:hypothetical protein
VEDRAANLVSDLLDLISLLGPCSEVRLELAVFAWLPQNLDPVANRDDGIFAG